MASFQQHEDPDSAVIPTVEITDYSTEALEFLEEDLTAQHQPTSSLSPPSKKKSSKKRGKETTPQPEKGKSQMSSKPSKHHSSKGESSKSKSSGDEDWKEITEPNERRRIQNRIAQRKFRTKAREKKERAQRDSQNEAHAGSSYHIPEPEELGPEDDLSGLPWGGLNMGYVVAKGHESASQQGSRRTSDNRLEESHQFLNPYAPGYAQVASYDGQDSIGDDNRYYEDPPYYYEAPPPGPGPQL